MAMVDVDGSSLQADSRPGLRVDGELALSLRRSSNERGELSQWL